MKSLKLLLPLACACLLGLLAFAVAWVPANAWAQSASSPLALTNATGVGPLAGTSGSDRHFSLNVPAGATAASFAITGSAGDADLYVRYGAAPTTSTWDYRPYLASSNETVNVSNPRAGTWYLMVRGYTNTYSGVVLKAQYAAATAPSVAATPRFSPAPGTYSGQVNVQLASSTPNAVVRFTLDGSTPSTSSEIYTAPIMVGVTTQIKASAFATGYAGSAVLTGTFTISNSIQMLTHNLALQGLSGSQGSVANFKFTVPAGVSSVSFTIDGNSGDADLYVKYGQLATTSVYDHRPYIQGSRESVIINTPQAGDYYVMIQGYRAYSGVSLKAAYSGAITTGKPDLVVWGPGLNPYITTETFSSTSCEIQEGTITAGTKKLLRFSTQTHNIGTADLVLGNPATSAMFEWGPCHGHYHFRGFAQYRLLDANGSLVRTGKKVGFCLMDTMRVITAANPSARYSCSNQGIQAGWGDLYAANLSGQWIDITGLPAGLYILEITTDPMGLIDELDKTNNTARVNVTIP